MTPGQSDRPNERPLAEDTRIYSLLRDGPRQWRATDYRSRDTAGSARILIETATLVIYVITEECRCVLALFFCRRQDISHSREHCAMLV